MKSVTRDESRDTGLAMVVLLLVAHLATKRDGLVPAAMVVLVVAMLAPWLFKPVAVVWLGLARLLGLVSSKVLLTLVFFVVVTPIGWVRRLAGKDALRLRAFKASEASAFTTRRHVVVAADLEPPY